MNQLMVLLMSVFMSFNFSSNVKLNTGPGDATVIGPTFSSGRRSIFALGDTVYVVWKEDISGTDEDIYFAKSTDRGETFLAPIRVDDAGAADTSDQQYPGIYVDNTGVIYIAWRDYREGYTEIRSSKSTDSGNSFLPSVVVNDSLPISNKNCPSVWVLGDSVYVVWHDNRNGDFDIYFSKSEDGGTSFLTDVRVDDDMSGSMQREAVISVATNCEIYVMWADLRNSGTGYDVLFSKSTDGGLTFLPDKLVNDEGAGSTWQLQPAMTIDSEGNIYACWTDARQTWPWHIFFCKSTDGGETFLSDVKVSHLSDGGAEKPSIAIKDSLNIFIVWQDDRAGQWNIYFAYSETGGSIFFGDTQVDDGMATSLLSPNIAFSSDRVYVIWSDNREHSGNMIYDVYFSYGSSVGVKEGKNFSYRKEICLYLINSISSGILLLNIPESLIRKRINLRIYDLAGKPVFTHNFLNPSTSPIIPIYHLPSGQYFLAIETNQGKYIGKFVLIR